MKNNFEDTNAINIIHGEIRNKELKKYIQFRLGKDNFEIEELKELKDIIIDGRTLTGDKNNIFFDEIELFTNLEKIEISNAQISKEDTERLRNIREISFKKCSIDSLENLLKVTKLEIKSSSISQLESIEKLEQIEELELSDIEIHNFYFLKNLDRLKVLKIKNVKDFTFDKIKFDLPIKYLSIEKIDTLLLNEIQEFKDLEYLSIDREEAEQFKEELDKIENSGIKILLNDIYDY